MIFAVDVPSFSSIVTILVLLVMLVVGGVSDGDADAGGAGWRRVRCSMLMMLCCYVANTIA